MYIYIERENIFYLENTFYLRIPACPPSGTSTRTESGESKRAERARAHARELGEERKRRNPTAAASLT